MSEFFSATDAYRRLRVLNALRVGKPAPADATLEDTAVCTAYTTRLVAAGVLDVAVAAALEAAALAEDVADAHAAGVVKP